MREVCAGEERRLNPLRPFKTWALQDNMNHAIIISISTFPNTHMEHPFHFDTEVRITTVYGSVRVLHLS